MYKSDILCIEHNSSRNLHELFAIENHFIILVSLTESRQMFHSICSSCERKKPEQDRYNNTNTRVTNLNTLPPSLSCIHLHNIPLCLALSLFHISFSLSLSPSSLSFSLYPKKKPTHFKRVTHPSPPPSPPPS